jgi:hypothetical protein
LADGFPVADAHDLLAAVAGGFAVEERVAALGAAEERGDEADAVDVARGARGGAGDFEEGGEPVFETADAGGRRAGSDAAGPAHECGDAETAFIEGALAAAEVAVGVEKIGVGAAEAVVERAVVGGENPERVALEAELFDEIHEAADLAVEARDHRGVGGARVLVREVAAGAVVGLLGEFAAILGERVLGDLEREVRNGGGNVTEKRAVFVRADEGAGLFGDQIGGVDLAGERRVGGGGGEVGAGGEFLVRGEFGVADLDVALVVPEVRGVEVVGDGLAVVAVKTIEALLERHAVGAGSAEAPFAETAGGVARGFEKFRERDGVGGDGELALGFQLAVVADEGVAGMFAGHEHAARRSADVVPRVVMRELQALGGEAVEVRRADEFLAEGADVAVAEIVGEDEDDVGRTRGRGGDGGQREGEGGERKSERERAEENEKSG